MGNTARAKADVSLAVSGLFHVVAARASVEGQFLSRHWCFGGAGSKTGVESPICAHGRCSSP